MTDSSTPAALPITLALGEDPRVGMAAGRRSRPGPRPVGG